MSGALQPNAARARATGWAGLALALVLAAFWWNLGVGGGSVDQRVKGGGFSSSRAGWSAAWGACRLGPGRSLHITCEVTDWKAGELLVHVWECPVLGLHRIVETHRLRGAGRGEWTFEAPKPGRYRVSFSPVPDGRGYEFAYRGDWTVRRGG